MFFALLVHAEQPQFPDAQRLLIESIGGDSAVAKLKGIKTIETFGTGNTNGFKSRFHMIVAPPDRIYLDIQHEGYSLGRIVNGNRGWIKTLNGKFTPMNSTELSQSKGSFFAETFQFLFPDSSGRIPRVDSKSLNPNHACWKVMAPSGKDGEIPFYIDATSKNILATEGYMDNMHIRSVNTEFDTISGIIFPTKTISRIEETKFELTQEIDSILLRNTIRTTVFQPSAGKTSANFPKGVVEISIPIEYVNGHILVRATINGKRKLKFILDTGCSTNLFHEESIRDLSLPTIGTLPFRGIGGIQEMPLVRIDTMEIGGLKFLPQAAGVTNISGVASETISNAEMGGLLGFDFFSDFPVTINLEQLRMTIHDPKNFTISNSAIGFPLEFYSQVPTISATICGVSGVFLVDLGNAAGVLLHQSFINQYQLESCLNSIDFNSQSVAAIGGTVGVSFYRAKSFSLGTINYENLAVAVPDSSSGISGTSDIAGNFGSLFFKPYEITFDYPNRMLYLRLLKN
ncbi:MAG: retroviral-like aspartic protease family protein [Candidatus Zixiibacteriota bacterium]